MRRSFFALSTICVFGVVTITGCGGAASKPVETLVPAEGVVLINGKPEAGIQVHFTPTKDAKSHGGSAVTDDSGEFRMRNYMNRGGVPVGEYIVTFSLNANEGNAQMTDDGRPIPGITVKEKIPAKWSDPSKAGKHNKIMIPDGGVKDLSFKVTAN